MLADVTFMVSASVALTGVAESFVAHEIFAAERFAASGQEIGVLSGNSIGPDTVSRDADSVTSMVLDEATMQRAGGISLLRGLSALSPREIVNYVQENVAQLDAVRDARIAPAEITSWWAAMPATAQQAMASSVPQVLGSLDGVPAAVRGPANEDALQRATEGIRERAASGIGKGERRKLGQQQRMLEAVASALTSKPGEPERTLLEFDERGSGRAVIVIGDLDSADYVSYLVPGMYFSVQQQILDWTDTAATLAVTQQQWLQDVPEGQSPPRVATIAWLGYQTPDLLNVGGLELAQSGADALEQSWQGIRATRGEHQPFLSVLAHSYGSTAAMIALQRHSEQIDALALIGSPGSASQTASDLGVADDQVYVGEASWDPIVDTAFYGSDPGSESFGAMRIGVSGGVDPLTKKTLGGSVGHNAYFAAGSESLRNLALIGIGRGTWVTDADGAAPGTSLAQAR